MPEAQCHLCGSQNVVSFESYGKLPRVTSDCLAWPPGGSLRACQTCGCIQKSIDAKWQAEIAEIYGNYNIYHQSNGAEQLIFDSAGQAGSRSSRLANRLQADLAFSSEGRLLDVGCGNGAFLRAFNKVRPRWALAGTELNDINRKAVEAIPNVEQLYVGGLNAVPGKFDLISMIHVLEHIPDPVPLLLEIKSKLNDGGRLVIEVPDCISNPFDLLVADHSTHFTLNTLRALVQRAGYEVLHGAADWIPKELSVVARPGNSSITAATDVDNAGRDVVNGHLRWLEESIAGARKSASTSQSFGLFGTSIAGIWLFGALENAPQFFVDEDPLRVGKTLSGRPVYAPGTVPAGSQVYMVLPKPIAQRVAARMSAIRPDVDWTV